MRVPTGSICGLISPAALLSKRMTEPSGRLISLRMRTTTAFITSPFLTRPRGAASLTDTTMTSPIVAYFRLEPPSTLMHMTRRAPELSATSRLVCIWIIDAPLPLIYARTARYTFAPFSPRTTVQRLSREIGRCSSSHTMSPTEYSFFSSWAWYFFERRTVFFRTGCVKRRSTRTMMVLSCLSLTTVPCRVRFGILESPHFAFSAAPFCAAMVLMRAMSRRTSRTRPVFSSCPVARWKRRLNCSFLSFMSSSESWSGVIARTSSAFISLLHDALDEARPDRKLGGGKRKRFLGELGRDAVHLEQDAAGLHPRDPQFDAALAGAHADFE